MEILCTHGTHTEYARHNIIILDNYIYYINKYIYDSIDESAAHSHSVSRIVLQK